MKYNIYIEGQLRLAAGVDQIELNSESSLSLHELWDRPKASQSSQVTSGLFTEGGTLRRSLLVFIDNQPVSHDEFANHQLDSDTEISILSPIAGG